MTDLFATFDEAKDVNPYTLARRWLETPGSRRTLAMELDELATMAALARWLTRWVPLQVHRVLTCGGTVEQASAASGMPVAEMAAAWRRWAAGQRSLGLPGLDPAEYDAVAAKLDAYMVSQEITGGAA